MKPNPVDIAVIFNPHAGKKRAFNRLQRLQQQTRCKLHLLPTGRPGHGEELAAKAAREGFSFIAAAGGDGTVHEVANGILAEPQSNAALVLMPIGSANDYYHSLQMEDPPANPNEGRLVDVGLVKDPGGKKRHFVCCLGLGLNGAVTREARRIRGLQGVALYGLAALRALCWHYNIPDMEIRFDEEGSKKIPTLMLSVMVGKREGNFIMAPDARVDDGWFDYVHAGRLSRLQILRLLPRLAIWGAPKSYPGVLQDKCKAIALRSDTPLTVHIDGEFFCLPEDGVCELEIKLLEKKLRVLTDLPQTD